MLIGLLGSISSEMQSLTSDRILFQSKLENAKSLALRKGLNREIRDKLAGYFQYNWDRCRGVDETQVFLIYLFLILIYLFISNLFIIFKIGI